MNASSRSAARSFLAGGGVMGERMRSLDWAKSPLGPPGAWHQSLKTIVRIMLDSRYAMWMLWGPELTFFCNDAYLPTLGIKVDWVLGARSDAVWEEIWPDIGPRIRHVLETGEATWDEALLLYLERSGFAEESYHTFSYSPIYDDHDRIAGMLCVVTEVTERVIGERRLHVLRDLAANAGHLESVADVGPRLCGVLQESRLDTPFAALYLTDANRSELRRNGVTGGAAASLLPEIMTRAQSEWPISELLDRQQAVEIADLPLRGLRLAAGPWPDLVQRALLLPLKSAGQTGVSGVLVVGASPRRPFDANYRSFLELIARQMATAIADARTNEVRRERAEALLEIDRAKTAFFSNVSHEFRTPITLILGHLDDLVTRSSLAAADRQSVEVAYRNSLRLLKLVNTLLDFSRIEAGHAKATYEATDLATLTRDLASLFRSMMERAGLTFEVDCRTAEPVHVDRDMWEKICLNLLSNAFKYTHSGTIRVSLGQSGDWAVLNVSDTGVGIAAEELPHIFERFHRADSTQGRTHEGSGIGLALVRELVLLHQGQVSAASEPGHGTTMTVRIPLGTAHLPAERLRVAAHGRGSVSRNAQAFQQEALRWLPPAAVQAGGIGTGHAPVQDRRFASTFGARVVLADDNFDMRDYVAGLLGPYYRVETVADGIEALAAAERERPALILSDVMMPNCDGFELLNRLRQSPGLRDIPFILVSARAGEEARVQGLTAGADDYLIKPFAARELLARVGSLIELTQMRQAGEERLRLAIDGARMATWELNTATGVATASPTLFEMLGDEPSHDGQVVLRRWHARIHPDDLDRVDRSLEQMARDRTLGHLEFRVVRADTGDVRWLSTFGRLLDEGGGHARRAVGITLDITDRKRAEESLIAADRRKDEFLATLAHELRNPLAPIRNAARILGRTPLNPEQLTWCREVIQRQVGHMALLLDDLLDVSRITLGRLHLKSEDVEIGLMIEAAVETARPLIDARGHTLRLRTLPYPLYVKGDFLRLAQAIANLLTNAAKYTDPGGVICVSARQLEQGVEIAVEDTGIGIDAADLKGVFTMFSQVDSALDRSQGGLGIGLALVKGLIELHGGTTHVASEGIGRGAVFTLHLPGGTRKPQLAAPTAERPAGARQGRRILIADDNQDAADSLRMLFELDGHDVRTAGDGAAAVALAETFRPEVAFVDIGMPILNGYEVAEQIRSASWGARMQLVALSGWGQEENKRRAAGAGFDDHMTKPVDPSRLEALLAKLGK